MKEIKRGDIYYANLYPVIGSEQGGVRPVLIIQNNAGNHFSPTVIAAAISSRQRKHTLPTHVALRGQEYGLRGWSMVLLEQIRTIDRSRLLSYIGKLDPERMEAVDEALTVSVGLGTAREKEGKRSPATGWWVNIDEWKKRERRNDWDGRKGDTGSTGYFIQ